MYIPRYFKIQELVSRDYFNAHGRYKNPDKLWLLFDDRLLRTIDALRERFGSCYINTWDFGGNLNYCGYRGPHCGIGAELSQHKFGRAVDLHFKTPEINDDVKKCIIAGEYPEIKGLELDVSWVHIDFRNSEKLVTFRP